MRFNILSGVSSLRRTPSLVLFCALLSLARGSEAQELAIEPASASEAVRSVTAAAGTPAGSPAGGASSPTTSSAPALKPPARVATAPTRAAGAPHGATSSSTRAVSARHSLGPISVGHPHAGFLFNAVHMPKDPRWVISYEPHAWGTQETVDGIAHCVKRVHAQFPATPPVFLGSLSPKDGGPAPPHKSHRTGRDADVYFYRQSGAKWFKAATATDIDLPRTWATLKCFISETDVDFVLIDQKPKAWLEHYALSIGEPAAWVRELFHGSAPYYLPLVKHIPGHVAHMHVRFASPIARERGLFAYDRLVEQGHLTLPQKSQRHVVAAGETLSAIAAQYRVKLEDIQQLNALKSPLIKVGQVLTVKKGQDIRGARDPVIVPPRRSPGQVASQAAETRAVLDEIERTALGALRDGGGRTSSAPRP